MAYSTTFDVTGGTGPLTWSVAAGSLPPGLTLNTGTGVLSGTPLAAGGYTFTVQGVPIFTNLRGYLKRVAFDGIQDSQFCRLVIHCG